MERTLIRDLGVKIGQTVQVKGWLQTLRDQKRMMFLVVRDPTGSAQVVIEREANPELTQTVAGITPESTLAVIGRVEENPAVRLGGLELRAEQVEPLGRSSSPLPFEPFASNLPPFDKRLDWRFLDLRRPENALIFQVETTVEQAMRDFFVEQGFVEIHSPKLMGAASESGAELFELDYFGGRASLAQSPQFYKQMAMVGGLEKVFEIGPAFRADKSLTTRHATEFTSIDVEMSWIDSHDDVMAFEERWLEYVIRRVRERHADEIRRVFGAELIVPKVPFPKVTLTEAFSIIQRNGYTVPGETKGDLDPQGERILGEYVKREQSHEFVFVVDWPSSVRPFYHMRKENDSRLTKSFDLLWKGLEITTGAQREHRYDVLVEQAKDKGIALEPIRFYFDFFKYGAPPHGGFGFGLARFMAVLLNRPNIREVTFLHRGPNRLEP